MPSKIVNANTAVQSVAAAVRNMTHKPTSITIENAGGSADRTIRVQDGFTPDITNAVGSPVATTVDRLRVMVPIGQNLILEEKDLKGIKCLGSLGIIADAIDAGCYISVGYESQ